MSNIHFLNAAAAYTVWRAGSELGSLIKQKRLKTSLLETYRASFVGLIIDDIISGRDARQVILQASDKLIYQKLFETFDEETADFFLTRSNKARMMGVDINLDAELAGFIQNNGLVSPAFPYSTLLGQHVLAEISKLENSNPERTKSEDDLNAECLVRVKAILRDEISYGKLKGDPLIASKGYIFLGKKYACNEAALEAKIAALKIELTPSLLNYLKVQIAIANREVERIDALDIKYFKSEHAGLLTRGKYKIDGKYFSKYSMAEEYKYSLKEKFIQTIELPEKIKSILRQYKEIF